MFQCQHIFMYEGRDKKYYFHVFHIAQTRCSIKIKQYEDAMQSEKNVAN